MLSQTFDGYRQVFSQRSFTLFWTGFTLSAIGDAMARVALTWYVWNTTQSPAALGLLSFLYMAPIVVGGLVAGWLLDRFGRRRVMALDNFVRGIVFISIPLLAWADALELWHIYVAAALYGSLMMISLAGGPAILPSLVRARNLSTANALETIGFTISGVIGPPIAGVLLEAVDMPLVLLIDASTYLAFAVGLLAIRTQSDDRHPETDPRVGFGLGNAFGLMLRNRVLLSTTLMYMSFNLGLGAMLVWLPVFADETLNGGARLYGNLLGFMAIGSMISSLVAGGVSLPMSLGRMICFALIAAGTSVGLIGVFRTVWSAAVGMLLFGAFSAPLTIWAQTLRMAIIPEHLRGRTFALLRMLMQSSNPVGGLGTGPLIPLVGIWAMIGLSAVLVSIPGVLGFRVSELLSAKGIDELESQKD